MVAAAILFRQNRLDERAEAVWPLVVRRYFSLFVDIVRGIRLIIVFCVSICAITAKAHHNKIEHHPQRHRSAVAEQDLHSMNCRNNYSQAMMNVMNCIRQALDAIEDDHRKPIT